MHTVSHVCSQLGSRSHQRRSDLHRKKAQLFAFSAGSCVGVGVRGQSCEPSNLARGRQKGVFIEHLICARYWASHLIPNTLEKGVWSSSCINNHPPTPPTPPRLRADHALSKDAPSGRQRREHVLCMSDRSFSSEAFLSCVLRCCWIRMSFLPNSLPSATLLGTGSGCGVGRLWAP